MMARRYPALTPKQTDFITRQHLFFVATAAPEGRVNLSPKGGDSLRVLDPRRVIWRNLTGSGNETAAHLRQSPRMTLMFCAFDGDPLILRLYGEADATHRNDPDWRELDAYFPPDPGARQIIELHIDLVQTSCGFGVPLFDYRGERHLLADWAWRKGEHGIRTYWAEKNRLSLDGLPTGIPAEPTGKTGRGFNSLVQRVG